MIRLPLLLAAVFFSFPAHALDFAGSWKGAYECDGVVRDISIDLLDSGVNLVSGMVTFEVDGEVARYAVRGAISPDNTHMVIEPSGWVDRPEGYAMVGMQARRHGDALFGRMSSNQCSSFYAIIDEQ